MKKSIKLNSQEWCDIVFRDKNQAYGAYKLRQSSSKRHIAAFGATLIFALIVAAIPMIVNAIEDYQARNAPLDGIDEVRTMVTLPESEVPEENIIREQTAPPPPPLKTTFRFVPPIIADDDEIPDDIETPTQEEALDAVGQISIATIVGTDEEGAIDIAELEQQKIIVEAEPEVFQIVEQMPSYPGGDIELMRFIKDNLKYPIVAQENGIQGQVVLRFVVTPTGSIDEVTVLRGLDPSCDREAMRVVKAMPKWIPGRQSGKAVPVYFTLPIRFQLK